MLTGQCYTEWLSSIRFWHSYLQSYWGKAEQFELLTYLKRNRTAVITLRDYTSHFSSWQQRSHMWKASQFSPLTQLCQKGYFGLCFWDPLAFPSHTFSSFSSYSSSSFSSSSSSISVNSQYLFFLIFKFQKAKLSPEPFVTQKIKTRAGSESESPQVWDPVLL